jgi:hypothetical protein
MDHSKVIGIKSALKAIKSPIQALSIAIEKGVKKGGKQPFKEFNDLFDSSESELNDLRNNDGITTMLTQFTNYVLKEGIQDNLNHLNETGLKILSIKPDVRQIRTKSGEPLEVSFAKKGMHQLSNELRELTAIRNHFAFVMTETTETDIDFDIDIEREVNNNVSPVDLLLNLDDMLDSVFNRHYFRDYDISEMLTDLDFSNVEDQELFNSLTIGTSRRPQFSMVTEFDDMFDRLVSAQNEENKKLKERAPAQHHAETLTRLNKLITKQHEHSLSMKTRYQFKSLDKPYDPETKPDWNWSQSTTNDLFKIFAYEIKGNYPEVNPERIDMINKIGHHIISMKPDIAGLKIRGEKVEDIFARKGLGELAEKITSMQPEEDLSMKVDGLPTSEDYDRGMAP